MSSFTPRTLPEPTEESHDRQHRILWPVGRPDDEGYQTHAALEVIHHGRSRIAGRDEYAYVATLRYTSIRREGGVSSEVPSFDRAGVLIDRTPAKRFSTKALAAATAAARVQVQTRYAAGDSEVAALLGGTTPRPLPTPLEETGDQKVRILWPIGDPDGEGYQRYADLIVDYFALRQDSYAAVLAHTRIRRTGEARDEVSDFGPCCAHIANEPATHFSAEHLTSFAAAARATVEQRYAAGDPRIVELLAR